MKFFGWGRKKDPQPIHHEVEKPVAAAAIASGICSPGTSEWGSRDVVGQELLQGRPRPWKDDYCQESLAAGDNVAGSEVALEVDRLQETIRFVFSHEQEGLLAIGTFALDQLAAGVRFGLDDRLKPAAATEQQSCNRVNSSTQVVQPLLELRSSDDETESHHSQLPSLIPTCTSKELPVSGDRDALLSDLHRPIETTKPFGVLPIVTPSRTTNPVIIDSPKADTSLPKFHDVPEVVSLRAPEPYQSDEEFYSPGVCGLFASRSRRTQKLGEKQHRKKLPPENQLGNSELCNLKKTNRSKGLSSLGRLWRSGYNGPPESELPPTAKRESSQMQNQGLPCIANVDLEDGTGAEPVVPPLLQCSQKRRGAHSFGKGTWACAQNGKWIRTDSEFVVLEM